MAACSHWHIYNPLYGLMCTTRIIAKVAIASYVAGLRSRICLHYSLTSDLSYVCNYKFKLTTALGNKLNNSNQLNSTLELALILYMHVRACAHTHVHTHTHTHTHTPIADLGVAMSPFGNLKNTKP